jgi:tetratricopeptide (TPR) repeat protein
MAPNADRPDPRSKVIAFGPFRVDLHAGLLFRGSQRIMLCLGEACILADRFEDAFGFAWRALTLAREGGQRGYEAWALRLLADVTARRDSPELADGHYRDALALGQELGMRPVVAHCHLGLGKLYRRTGRPEQVKEHLTTAVTMYREMDMRFYLEQAEAQLRELSPG